jgi:excisionase family DNA binding protein
MNDPLVLRLPDVARALACSEVAARKLVQRGRIPSRKLGRSVVVLVEELHAYLQSLAPAAKSSPR